MKHSRTQTPDAIIETLTLDTEETKAVADRYLNELPEGDRAFCAAMTQSLSALFGIMQLPIESPSFATALRILADTFELAAPEITKRKAELEKAAKETALERFDSTVRH